ncbi:peptidase T. Metallo peptidase. MEROPS family M20B [Alkalispirochaeta americana]|uniref:Peptidase T n=1 Tax=Alkalispirochaeta americana TaxID=159291 RepID=A0A1N6THN1_9SPIO|nr:peptidase T [Alkalispirochaeta americana]SIQ52747.1 peptidase T. Metallo peptidase. MEROPS family M20B [Alkalispirochaeta americana]
MDLTQYHALLTDDVQERFLRYVRVHTTSDRHCEETPSTKRQFDLAHLLARELKEMGVSQVSVTDHCYVTARLPASPGVTAPPLLLLAHLDTAPDLSGEGVSPRLWESYDGSPLELGHGYRLDPAEYPDLLDYIGDTVITTDGSTLLGADDKAGVAEIMSALRFLQDHPEVEHGLIEVIFTPDEEIGRGVDKIPLEWITAQFAFTLDGGRQGSIEAECFSAWQVQVEIEGYVIHPGSAKNKLVNAVALAGRYLAAIPQAESPEATEGRDGFYCPVEVRGDYGRAEIELIVRDFDQAQVDRRVAYLKELGKTLELAYPRSRIEVRARQQYLNMYDTISRHPFVMDVLEKAVRAAGLEPVLEPIRGGTDGSRLTEMGIPTPNIFAGGFNFHGRYEWIPVSAMRRATETILHLVRLWKDEVPEKS